MLEGCDFVAIDVETANSRRSSICQIGLARYVDGELAEELALLINPEEEFNPMNIRVHGISSDDISNCLTFPQAKSIVDSFLNNNICVCHTTFDQEAINQAICKYGLSGFNTIWLDTAQVTRRTWDEFSVRGYGLANVCQKIGYEFEHHNALDDAKASAHVLMAAIEATGNSIDIWIKHLSRPSASINNLEKPSLKRDGNPDGPLFGEVLVFTGELEFPRSDAVNLAADVGCAVKTSVTKKTTLLIVGDLESDHLGNIMKSGKHKEAEELIKKGQNIRILNEEEFIKLILNARKSMRFVSMNKDRIDH